MEEAKAAEAREKERRLREYQLLRTEREKWELQCVGSIIAREAIETAISRWKAALSLINSFSSLAMLDTCANCFSYAILYIYINALSAHGHFYFYICLSLQLPHALPQRRLGRKHQRKPPTSNRQHLLDPHELNCQSSHRRRRRP